MIMTIAARDKGSKELLRDILAVLERIEANTRKTPDETRYAAEQAATMRRRQGRMA